MVSIWKLDVLKQVQEHLVANDQGIEYLLGGPPCQPPLDIENRILVTPDAYVYMVYTNATFSEIASVERSMINVAATRILLDHFLFDTGNDVPGELTLQDCPYGSVILVRTDHQLNLINYPWHLLAKEWGQFFKRSCPYYTFGEQLIHDPHSSCNLEKGVYDSLYLLSRHLREPYRNTGAQRQRIDQVYHGVYIYFNFYSMWKDLPNPTTLKIRRLNYGTQFQNK